MNYNLSYVPRSPATQRDSGMRFQKTREVAGGWARESEYNHKQFLGHQIMSF
jgi:hypothetical protein